MTKTWDSIDIVRLGEVSDPLPDAEEIGAKAANLARMLAIGLPVPPAFVLPVRLCADIAANDAQAKRVLPDLLTKGIGVPRTGNGETIRRPAPTAAGFGALGGVPVDARNAGYRAERWLHCRGHARPDTNDWKSALRLGLPPPFPRSLRANRSGPRCIVFRRAPGPSCRREGAASDRDLDCEALERLASGILVVDRRCRVREMPRCSSLPPRRRASAGPG